MTAYWGITAHSSNDMFLGISTCVILFFPPFPQFLVMYILPLFILNYVIITNCTYTRLVHFPHKYVTVFETKIQNKVIFKVS